MLSGANDGTSGKSESGDFDYPSVAVDASSPRRIIIGGVLYQNAAQTNQCLGYFIRIGTYNPTLTWGPYVKIASSSVSTVPSNFPQNAYGDSTRWGINARVVAAGNQFYVFLPTLQSGNLFQPLSIYAFYENGGAWTTLSFNGNPWVVDFHQASPKVNNPNCLSTIGACQDPPLPPSHTGYVFYAPLIDVSGNDSGGWAVTYQSTEAGVNNNVHFCTNLSVAGYAAGCIQANPYAVDQFMNGVTVGPEGGVWVSYLGFQSNYGTPLYHQSLYFPPTGSGSGIGNTGDYHVEVKYWPTAAGGLNSIRCNSFVDSCYWEGDYARIGGNGYQAIDSPYVSCGFIDGTPPPDGPVNHWPSCTTNKQNAWYNLLYSRFYQDPPGAASNTFVLKPIWYPLGVSLPASLVPNPPQTLGVAPERMKGVPPFVFGPH